MEKKQFSFLLLSAVCLSLSLSGCDERFGEGSSFARLAFTVQGSSSTTRSIPTFTENLQDFDGTAFLNRTSDGLYDDCWCGIRNVAFEKEEGSSVWSHSFKNNESWPDGNGLLAFFFHYPSGSTVGAEGITTVSYSRADDKNVIQLNNFVTPGSGSDTAAEEQTDHVFATTLVSESTGSSAQSILFYHPFAAVKFQKGTVQRVDDKDITFSIKAITLKNVYDKGTCTLIPYYGQKDRIYNKGNSNHDGDASTKSAACAAWTIDETSTAEFRQTFTDDDYDTTPADTLFPEGFATQKVGTSNNPPNLHQVNTTSLDKTFIVIPQTFDPSTHELSLMLDIELDGLLYRREVPVTSTVTWKAGGLYTYAINLTLTEMGWTPNILATGWYTEDNINHVYVPQP